MLETSSSLETNLMSPPSPPILVSLDVGNSRIKAGLFDQTIATELPRPREVEGFGVQPDELQTTFSRWLDQRSEQPHQWRLASVNRHVRDQLLGCIARCRPDDQVVELSRSDLALSVELPRPEQAGIDRLLGAVAANRIRDPERAALVIDLGTAVTVDVVSPAGAFLGGAILPGVRMAARALHEHTDLLPEVAMVELDQARPVLGKSTIGAIESGLFWGAIGAIRELTARLGDQFEQRPTLILTGGAAPSVADLLSDQVHYEPALVLSGIALSAPALSP